MPRRRLSSDGFKLFNLAHQVQPSQIKQLLACIFHSEYDDKLETMTNSCQTASKQLFAYFSDPIKKKMINKFIDNSIFNIIYAILSKDQCFATAFQTKNNYRYFMDVLEMAHRNGDHNTAIMLLSALEHHSLKQMEFKLRKKDIELFKQLEEEYGTWRNCYKNHLKMAMNSSDMEIIPSMMVLKMHVVRQRAYSTVGHCKVKYEPEFIQGKIGIYALHHVLQTYDEVLPLYNQPPVNNSTDLILIASRML
jgi:hypothetical protein